MAGIRTWIEIDTKRAKRALGGLDAATDKTGKKFSGLQKLGAGMFAGFSTAVVTNELRKIAASVVEVGKTFETFGVLLGVHFGDDAARVFDDIKKFALESPGQVSGITSAWIGLQSVGITPTIELMRKLDDVASSSINATSGQTRSLAELSEAIRKAITGETESLKGFNIIARLKGDEITLQYKNTRRTVQRTARAVSDAIAEIGSQNFAGAALKQMDTLAGASSNFEDAWESLASSIFEAGVGDLLADATRGASDFLTVVKPALVSFTEDFTAALVGLGSVLSGIDSEQGGVILRWLFGVARVAGMTRVIDSLMQARGILADIADVVTDVKVGAGAETDFMRAETAALKKLAGANATLIKQQMGIIELTAEQAAAEKKAAEEAVKAARLRAKAFDMLIGKVGKLHEIQDRLARAQRERARAQRESLLSSLDTMDPLGAEPDLGLTSSGGASQQRVFDEVIAGYIEGLQESTGVIAEDFEHTFQERIATVGLFLEKNWQGILADVIGTAIDAINKPRQRGKFGGALSDDFGDEGAQIGSTIGGAIGMAASVFSGPLGPLIGSAVGGVIGGVIGGAIKRGADEGLGTLRQVGDDVAAQISRDEGGLGWVVAEIGAGLADAIAGLESVLGGQISIGAGGIGIKVRDDIISVFANGITGVFEDIQSAIDFALVQAIKSAGPAGGGSISGTAPEVLQALQNFAGETAAQLNEDVALALRMQAGRLGTEHTAISTAMQTVTRDILDSVAKGISLEGGIARFADIRDDIMGVVLSQEEIFERRKAAFNLELDLAEIDLLARLEALNVEGQIVQQRANLTRAALEADAAYVQGLGGVVTMTANAARQMEIIRNALAQIADLRITATDIPSFGGGGGGGGDGGVAQRRAQRASLQERIDRLREERLGLDEASRAAAQLARDIAAVQEEARGTGFRNLAELIAEMEAAAARAEAARREGIISPFDEAARGGGLAQQLEDIRQRAVDAVAALGMVNELNGELNRIRAGEAAMIRELGDAALGSLGSQILASRDQARALGETIRFLTENMTLLGVSATDLDIALAEISSGAFLGAGGFLAQALGDEEQLLEFRRLEFMVQLETHRARIAALEAEGLLSEAHAETLADLFAQVDENVGEILAGFEEQAEEVARAVTSIPTGIIDEVQAFYDALRSRQIGSAQSPIAAIGMEFDLLMEQAERFKWRFREIGVDFRDVAAMIDEMRSAELAKAWQPFLDIVNQVSGGTAGPFSLAPGGTQLAQIQAGIRAAVSGGDPGEAARLAQQGLGIAGGMSSFRLRDFRSFLSGFGGLDTTAAGSEFAPLVDATRAMHLVTEGNRAAQTNALTGMMADQTSELRLVRKSLERMEEVDRPAA